MIRILIVEDVPLARAGLRRLLNAHKDVKIVGEASILADGLVQVRSETPDLVFLDVELPDGTGLELAAALDTPRPAIVFLTAFPEHALPAFGVEALDYLLKPIGAIDLARALDRVRRARGAVGRERAAADHLEIRDGPRTNFVPLTAIDRVDAAGHYLCVHAAGEVHLLRGAMADLVERLGPEFVRVHRSALVRADRVAEIVDRRNGDGEVRLAGGGTVPLSRTYRAALDARLATNLR